MEGATYALKFGVEKLIRLGVRANQIVLTGGGANSATWRQMVADVMDAKVRIPQQEEGAAFGQPCKPWPWCRTRASRKLPRNILQCVASLGAIRTPKERVFMPRHMRSIKRR